jgi:A/G-specific adenine glycosylase
VADLFEPASEGIDPRWLRRRVLAWFDEHGRDFPWRERRDPYRVLIAEILLQRTRADLVPLVFERFIARYPDALSLARATPDQVVRLLRPLGFAHRSARLPQLGREIVERHGGHVPRRKEELLLLTGVGEYVANAVLTVAFSERRPLLDPNVIRLLERVTGRRSARARPRDDPALWAQVESVLPRSRPADFALGLVDLGATICRARRPRCDVCPLHDRCVALARGGLRVPS